MAILICENSKKGSLRFIEKSSLKYDPPTTLKFKKAIQGAAELESCVGRDWGFSVFTVGYKHGSKEMDLWRIDESKVMKNY